MRRAARQSLHVSLLAGLLAGAVSGMVMLAVSLVGIARAALGQPSVPALSLPRVGIAVMMALLWGTVITAGLRALWRQVRRSVRLTRWVAANSAPPTSRLVAAAVRATAPDRIHQVTDDPPYAFTHGIWRPRIVVSTGLVNATTHDELVAVLRHEDHHRRHRDPLEVLTLRTVSAALFLIPLVGAVLQRILDRQELDADRAAMDSCGVPPVAAALLKAVGPPIAAHGSALAAMSGPALLEARVTQLETGRRPRLRTAFHRAAVLASLPGLACVALYGALLYRVCLAGSACCTSWQLFCCSTI